MRVLQKNTSNRIYIDICIFQNGEHLSNYSTKVSTIKGHLFSKVCRKKIKTTKIKRKATGENITQITNGK